MGIRGLKQAWQSMLQACPDLTYQTFLDLALQGKSYPLRNKGLVCGALIVLGNEIHICVKSNVCRWMNKKCLEILNEVIDNYGEAITRVTTEEGRVFVERLGFVRDGEIYRSRKKWDLVRYCR